MYYKIKMFLLFEDYERLSLRTKTQINLGERSEYGRERARLTWVYGIIGSFILLVNKVPKYLIEGTEVYKYQAFWTFVVATGLFGLVYGIMRFMQEVEVGRAIDVNQSRESENSTE